MAALAAFALSTHVAPGAALRLTGSYQTGSRSLLLATGDLNSDGNLDVVAAGAEGTVSVLLGSGNGSLALRAQYAVQDWPRSIRLVDLNGDKILDLLHTNGLGLIVMEGLGDGTLRQVGERLPMMGAGAVLAKDLNRDGIEDLVVVSHSNVVYNAAVLIGQGSLRFGPPVSHPTCTGSNHAVLADLNNDGVTDIAVTCMAHYMDGAPPTRQLAVLLGNGGGSFRPARILELPGDPYSVAAGDLDQDGNTDLVIQSFRAPSLFLLFGDGTGSFTIRTLSHGGARIYAVLADFDSDGSLDIAASGEEGISVFANRGNRDFLGPVATSGLFTHCAAGDFNNDGRMDLVTANSLQREVYVFSNSPADVRVSTFLLSKEVMYGEVLPLTGDVWGDNTTFSRARGKVFWYEGQTLLGSADLMQQWPWSVARLDLRLPAGVHTITARYEGDELPAQSQPVTVTVKPRTPSVLVLPSSSSMTYGQTIDVVVSVAPTLPAGNATGTVLLSDNGAPLATLPLNPRGEAVLTRLLLPAGSHLFEAAYAGDSNHTPAAGSIAVTVRQAPSTLSVRCTPNPAAIGEDVTCTSALATIAASGTVEFLVNSAPLGTGSVTQGSAFMNFRAQSAGTYTVQATYAGDANHAAASSLLHVLTVVPSLAAVSAADGRPALAPNSIASLYGTGISALTETANTLPLPVVLGGVGVTVVDSEARAVEAPLFFVSPTQINVLVPDVKPGLIRFVVHAGAEKLLTGSATVGAVSPALFSANATGKGAAAGFLLEVRPDGAQTSVPLAACDTSGCSPRRLSLDPARENFLILFGTGIRGASRVSATLGTENVEVAWHGPQPQFMGLDQLNLKLPRGREFGGVYELAVTADGQDANRVKVEFATGRQ